LLTSPRLEVDIDNTNKLFAYLLSIINAGSVSQTIVTLQTLLAVHTPPQLISILQCKIGLNIVQLLLKKGFDLNLSLFSREDILPQEIQLSQLATAGFFWKETIDTLVRILKGFGNFLPCLPLISIQVRKDNLSLS